MNQRSATARVSALDRSATGPWISRTRAVLIPLLVSGLALWSSSAAHAATTLTVAPITWNTVGLDSNSPTSGPYRFPVGARVCSSVATTNVVVNWVWDSSNANINLRPGSLSSITIASLGAGACSDAYFEAEVTQVVGAYDTTRGYHITATDTSGTASSPTPRELYVEHLISQNRNGITTVKLNGVSVPAGGTMTLMVGNTYTIELDGFTATQGYNQFESFINFPNTIFQILSVSTTYSADSNTTNVPNPNGELYANACIWENDPASPNYRSCVGGDDKAGGTVITTYSVKIISGAGTSQTLNSLLYDFSGSSFHYNADTSASARIASIVGPSSVTINKSFTPQAIAPGGTSSMTIALNNATGISISGLTFTDTFPTSPGAMTLANTTTTNTCGGSLTNNSGGALTTGDPGIKLSGGTLAVNGSCTITVNVTVPSNGTYTNTTGDLFINTTTDTGNSATASLVATTKPTLPSSCIPSQTLATWTMPTAGQGSGGPPPPYTTKATDVSSATATAALTGAGSQSIVAGATTNAWNITDAWPGTQGAPGVASGPYFQFAVDTTNYGGVGIGFDYDLETNAQWKSNANNDVYIYTSTDGSTFTLAATIAATKGKWNTIPNTAAVATGALTTYFRLTFDSIGAATGSVILDNISITGCQYDPPTLTKSFSPSTIAKGATSTLTFTFTNPSANALTGVAFSDSLPSGLVVNTPNGLTSPTCSTGSISGQTITATAGSSTISMSGATLAANSSCSFSVSILGNTAGQYTNTSGNIASTQTGPNTTANGYGVSSLTVVAPPVLAKSFSPTSIFTGNT